MARLGFSRGVSVALSIHATEGSPTRAHRRLWRRWMSATPSREQEEGEARLGWVILPNGPRAQ